MNRLARCIHQPKIGFEGHLKTGSTHQDIELMHFVVGRKDPLGHDLGDVGVEDGLDIRLHECFEISVSRGDTPATRSPFRDNEFLQLFMTFAHAPESSGVSDIVCIITRMALPVHLGSDDFSKLLGKLRTFFVHAK